MIISIADCDASAPTVMKSATGVDFDDVKDLGDGDVFEDKTAYLVTLEYGQEVDANLQDYDGDAVSDEVLAGFVMDLDYDYVSGHHSHAQGVPTSTTSTMIRPTGCSTPQASETPRPTPRFAPSSWHPVRPSSPTRRTMAARTHGPQLFGSLPGYASFLLFNADN